MSEQTNPTAFAQDDIEKNKVYAALAYLIFFIPLIACPSSQFGKFHANQGLLLLILNIVGSIVLGFIPFIGWALQSLLELAIFIVTIIWLINTLNGKSQELPILGKIVIIK